MTWTRLSDDFADQPAMLRISRDARLLHVEGLIWCNRMLTDGLLPAAAIRRLTDSPDPDAAVVELAKVGLWEEIPGEDSWRLDWTHQEASGEVRGRQEANAERQRVFRRRRDLHNRGDHSECLAGRCPALKGVTREVTRYETPSRPDPSRPVPTVREGQGPGAARPRSAGAPRGGDLSDQKPPPPHDFQPHRDETADVDIEPPTLPCGRCNHVANHLAHNAHAFTSDPEEPDLCSDCQHQSEAAIHTYQERFSA